MAITFEQFADKLLSFKGSTKVNPNEGDKNVYFDEETGERCMLGTVLHELGVPIPEGTSVAPEDPDRKWKVPWNEQTVDYVIVEQCDYFDIEDLDDIAAVAAAVQLQADDGVVWGSAIDVGAFPDDSMQRWDTYRKAHS